MKIYFKLLKPLKSDSRKCSNTFKQFVCLVVFDRFVESGLKGLRNNQKTHPNGIYLFKINNKALDIGVNSV